MTLKCFPLISKSVFCIKYKKIFVTDVQTKHLWNTTFMVEHSAGKLLPDFLMMEIFFWEKVLLRGQFKITSCFLSWHSTAKKYYQPNFWGIHNCRVEVWSVLWEVLPFKHKSLGCLATFLAHPHYHTINNKISGNSFAWGGRGGGSFFHCLLGVKHRKSARRLKTLLMLLTRIQPLWTQTVILVLITIRRSNCFLLQRCFVNNKGN